ncbi:hypothetical protein RI129_011640 [Pyrocoelia pectoralis]|uniref:Uncharacterized protein n=1 Tax=Pyrocoelia pectoralis TaxID=417401 RepID=A0AAN7V205_9COLE
MYKFKCGVNVLLIAVVIQNGHLISIGPGSPTDEILWNLSQYAVQSKQNLKNPSESQLHPEKFSRYIQKGVKNVPTHDSGKIIAKQNPAFTPHPYPRPSSYYHRYPLPPALPPGYQQQPQSFTDALQSIAKNDELQCVPRLLCELVSGPSTDLKLALPFNIDLDSVIRLLPFIGGTESSPILAFGRALLLGYTSKGNTDSCIYGYPTCPRDPDRLIEYLNNYNGGFFRYFNGNPSIPKGYGHGPYPFDYNRAQHYPHTQYNKQSNRRIQNKPVQYFTRPIQTAFKFPSIFDSEESLDSDVTNFNYIDDDFEENLFRQQKGIQFPNNYGNNGLRSVPMVFPDRTGTGELILDDHGFVFSSSDYVHFNK